MRVCSAYALKRGYFESLVLIGTLGELAGVEEVHVVSPRGIWKWCTARRRVTLRLVLQGSVSLIEAKEMISQTMQIVPELWEAGEVDFAEEMSKVTDFDSLLDLFRDGG